MDTLDRWECELLTELGFDPDDPEVQAARTEAERIAEAEWAATLARRQPWWRQLLTRH